MSSLFDLGKHGPDAIYAAIVDVGSGSVGLAIIASVPGQPEPLIIYSARERTPIRDISGLSEASKDIATAVVNAFLLLGNDGRQALEAYDGSAKISATSVSISAPWSYTIAKTVHVHGDEPFEITKSLVEDLTQQAHEEALKIIQENDLMDRLGLITISEATAEIVANGYITKNPIDQTVNDLSLTQMNGVAEQKLVNVIQDSQEKVLPSAELQQHTFTQQFHRALQSLRPDTSEACLIDVTHEATEIGVVRDGVLRYVTHVPYGSYTIAREISELCKLPKEEALGLLRVSDADQRQNLAAATKAEIDVIIKNYEEKLSDLFTRTGDTLSVPKSIFLHTDRKTEPFFVERIAAAAKNATTLHHSVHPLTEKMFADLTVNDSRILLSAYVFHITEPES